MSVFLFRNHNIVCSHVSQIVVRMSTVLYDLHTERTRKSPIFKKKNKNKKKKPSIF